MIKIKKMTQKMTTINPVYRVRIAPVYAFVVLFLAFGMSAASANDFDILLDDPEERAKNKASTSLKSGTSSNTLSTGTQSTTLSTGTQSTTLSTGTQSTTLQGGTLGTMIKARAVKKAKPVTILFLFDSSLSMKDKIGRDKHGNKIQKIDAAKQMMQKALMKIPPGVKLGLRVFGQLSRGQLECRATALLVPPGTGNRGAIIRRVRRIKPTGLTPLTYALYQAAEYDLRRIKGKKTIILITDGVDTCGKNPCSYIKTLAMKGISLKVDVVGLDIRRDGAKKKLDCIAKNSGGKYYDADTAAKLIDSVSASVSRAISGQVITNSSEGSKIKNIETPPDLVPILPMDHFDSKKKKTN